MRAEDQLQFMMDFNPDLFPTRKHCLNHLFCVIGNGYIWVNGELVDKDDSFKSRYKLIKPVIKAEGRDEGYYFHMCKMEQRLKDLMGKDYMITPDNQIYHFNWYPLSKEYSYLFNYPDDIKPDWLELLTECQHLLKEDGILK